MVNFTALHHIGFRIKCNDIDSSSGTIDLCSRLLLAAQLPSAISTITIGIQDMSRGLFMLMHNGRANTRSPNHFSNAVTWSQLDNALSNPSFVDLNAINFTIKSYMGHKREDFLSQFTDAQPNMQHILPGTYRLFSNKMKVTLESVVGKRAYERWACQDEFDEPFPSV